MEIEQHIGIMSRGIAKIPHLDKLLGSPIVKSFAGKFRTPISYVAGWGHKPSAQAARNYAQKHLIPYLAIEDGFLRSVKLGKYDPPLSVIVDDIGVYYDAQRPSRLEQLIRKELTESQRQRTENLIIEWKKARVSKYNHLKEIDPAKLPDKYVLLADQTKGDASVELGLADANSFQHMLEAALKEHPDCTVLIKVHPEVAAGIKEGYFDLKEIERIPRVKILTEDMHPVRLIEQSEAVYTVTSQIGFEALLWGKPVRTFGMPFYAGWGLTHDEITSHSRRKNVDITQLTHAALIEYPSYLHPETNVRCQVEDLIDWIEFQRKMRAKFPEKLYALNFSWNKKQSIKKFFSNSVIKFIRNEDQAEINSSILVWGSTELKRTDLKIIRLEDGFIRSVGLGADLIRPISWVADTTGIYYDATRPSVLESHLATFEPDEKMLARAKKLREMIVGSGLSKYNLGGPIWTKPKNLQPNQRIILVPGQVEADASIAKGALDIKTNYDLLKAVREYNPKGYILYKPHPDVVASLRKKGMHEERAEDYCDEIIKDTAIDSLIQLVDEVHVMTSLTGFEALLRGRKVVVYGMPFYAGWGLTTETNPNQSEAKATAKIRRIRKLSLDQLISGVLIDYPMYIPVATKGWISPEHALDLILNTQRQNIYFKKLRAVIRRIAVRLTMSSLQA